MSNYERDLAYKLGYNPARDITAAAAGKRKVCTYYNYIKINLLINY